MSSGSSASSAPSTQIITKRHELTYWYPKKYIAKKGKIKKKLWLNFDPISQGDISAGSLQQSISLYLPLSIPVIDSCVQPVSVAVHMELFQVSEFVQGMVLQVMNLYKLQFEDLLICSSSVGSGSSSNLLWSEILELSKGTGLNLAACCMGIDWPVRIAMLVLALRTFRSWLADITLILIIYYSLLV